MGLIQIAHTCFACVGQDVIEDSNLHHRGPDIHHSHKVTVSKHVTGLFYGSTLHFRGELTEQPLIDKKENIFLWNGEIFGGVEIGANENDGKILSNLLSTCENDRDILRVFSRIHGPWAFAYWQVSHKKLWFGRDVFGRRSLLCHTATKGHFMLSSVAVKPWMPWKEVPAIGIYCAQLGDQTPTMQSDETLTKVTVYPWAEPCQSSANQERVVDMSECGIFNKTLMSSGTLIDNVAFTDGAYRIIPPITPFNAAIPCADSAQKVEACSDKYACVGELADDTSRILSKQLISVLQNAVLSRTTCQSDKCDNCIKRQLATNSKILSAKKMPSAEPTNYSETPEHIVHWKSEDAAACNTSEASIANFPESCSVVTPQSAANSQSSCSSAAESKLESESAEHARGSRLAASHNDEECKSIPGCGHSRVAILFSGGVDSLLIAALADRCVPDEEPIDLLNVAFEQAQKSEQGKNKQKQVCPQPNSKYEVPDRKTGREGLEQLEALNNHRKWNFVEINVPIDELKTARTGHVKNLVYPLNTVLDDSIGCAIWFASRGVGDITGPGGEIKSYTSPARIVLVGMGADEQFAGYSRHRVKFSLEGWVGLVNEIQMEIERISSRNLGRDDRVISDHGRESRFPFLDENVVSFLNSLPLDAKTNLHLPRGIGEKFLLRLAAESIGLTKGAIAPKRAIQFGSRIAKAENRKEKGSDSCDRLQE